MAEGEVEITSYGLPKNSFKTLDAMDYRGADSFIMDIEEAKDNNVVAGSGPNQVLLDTDYQKIASDWVGSHQLTCKWFGSISSGKGLVVEYWKKDQNGIESNPKNLEISWKNAISSTFGNGIGACFFSANDSYRIKILSHPSISLSDWVGIDYIALKSINEWNTISYYVKGGNTPSIENRLVDSIDITFSNSITGYADYTLPENDWNEIHVYPSVWGSADFSTGYSVIDSSTIRVFARALNGPATGDQTIELDISMYIPLIEL